MAAFFLKLVYYLVLAFVIGTLAQLITGYHKRRMLTTFILGFIGVFAGDFIAYHFGLPHGINIFGISVLWSILGAILFILAFRLVRGRW